MQITFQQNILSLLLLSSLLASGCSTDKIGAVRDQPNKISPYDVDFDSKSFSYNRKVDDENEEEEQLLTEAQSAYDSGLYTLAREKWSRLKDNYPASFYVPFVELKIADSYYLGGDQAQAISSYQEFIKLHPGHEAIPYVQLQISKAYRDEFAGGPHDPTPLQSALKSLHVLTENFPQSEYAAEGWRLTDECRELLAQYDFDVAKFYQKLDKKEAARARFIDLLATYSDTNVVRENMEIIGQTIDRDADAVAAVDKPLKKETAATAPTAPNILLALNEPEVPSGIARSGLARSSLRTPPTRLSAGPAPSADTPEAPVTLTCGESGSTKFASLVSNRPNSKFSVTNSGTSETTVCMANDSLTLNSQSCDLGQTKFIVETADSKECVTIRYQAENLAPKPTVISTSRPNRVVIIFPKASPSTAL